MNKTNKFKLIYASSIASIASALFVVFITIAAELSTPLKDWLKGISGHHWTTKSIFSLLIFGVVVGITYYSVKRNTPLQVRNSIVYAIATVITGTIAITFFYWGHHIGIF